ncbi:MAG: MotA/TolQ/ExbB proton channel family protein [Alphaproteobacteria bacterium]|nr:MotA/TolQ/ExbB proton channel family protein [Alphaproteobacteria bacterium]
MKKFVAIFAVALTAMGVGAASQPAQAQDEPRAASLEELVEIVRQGTMNERAEAERRVQEFIRQKNNQQQLLNQAKAELQRQEQRSQRLEETFDENEIKIGQLNNLLQERQGSLGELFGAVRQSAGDLGGVVKDSIISAQYTDRSEFLSSLAQKKELPSIEELEQLWYEYMREMRETGRVVEFPATVITDTGNVEEDVVRVGAFNLVSDGRYLQYNGETGRIEEFPVQPAGRFTSSAEALQDAESGYVAFGIDPSRGAILGLEVRKATLVQRWHQGGIVGYIVSAVGLLGLLLVLYRWIDLFLIGNKVNAQMKQESANTNNPLGRVMKAYEDNRNVDVETLELKLDEAILKDVPKIERGLSTIKVISVVAPLMGLLGTVTGMIQTFQAITLYGTGDPKIMAGGISQALVTTVLGLVVAIPMTLLYTLVASRAQRIIHVLEEQAAGIVALHAEKKKQ